MAYEFLGPRKIITGENSIKTIPNEMKNLRGNNALVVTDNGIIKAGILRQLISVLDDAKVQYKIFSEVEPDPEIGIMEKGKAAFVGGQHNIIIAFGGGSSIDTAKVISLLATNEGTVKDYLGMVILKNDPIPVIAIPTTAGTGSEVTHIAMATDKDNNLKRIIKGPQIIPKAAVLDPTLLSTLPPVMISYTGIDAFTHALESYLSTKSNLITEQLSLGAIKLIYHALIPFKENPKDTEFASKMLHGSSIAGIAFTNADLGAVHSLAAPIASQYHLPHGLSCAFFLCNVLKKNREAALDKYAILFEALGFSKNGLSNQKCADKLIESIERFLRKLEIPTSLKSLGIKHEVLPQMIEYVFKSPALTANPKKLDRDEIEWLLNSVR